MKQTVAVSAPAGRNNAVICQILTGAGIKCGSFAPAPLVEGLAAGDFAAAVLSEEALHRFPMADLQRVLLTQPAWSDFKFIVLIARGQPSPATVTALRLLGNATQIERPVHPVTLIGAVRSAIRARDRQRQAEELLNANARAEQQLRDLAATLDEQVTQRTQALAEANYQLKREMSERIASQARLHSLQEELIHLARVGAMGTMATTLAHELNQPLTAMMNYASGSRRLLRLVSPPVPQEIHTALEDACGSAHRAGEIVRRLRDFVSRGEIKRRGEALPALIEDALKLGMLDAALSGVTCQLMLDPNAPAVLIDRVQIQQVLVNLVRNAIEAMMQTPVKTITIKSCRKGSMVEVSVADTGPGIPAESIANLFQPFSSSKANGMGIGLSICRTIVEANGGTITGGNEPNGGAKFRFTMPATDRVE